MLLNPCCCTTGTCDQECCNGGRWPDSIVCDLGVLGWVDAGCDACDTIGGQYTLTYDTINSNPLNNCIWKYTGPTLCSYELDCSGIDRTVSAKLLITATLSPTCNWSVLVLLDTTGVDDSCPNPDKSATYTATDTGGEDCDALELDFASEGFSSNVMCSGTWPATIELSR